MTIIWIDSSRFARPASFSLTASSVNTGGLSTYTFSGLSLGQEASNRRIIVALAGQNQTRTVTSLTVAGVAATRIIGDNPIASGRATAQLWIADVPSGTTGNVVVTLSGGSWSGCAVGLYAAYDLTTNTPHDSKQATSSTTQASLNLAYKSGFIIAVAAQAANAATSFTWSGLNEDFDLDMEPTNRPASGASLTTSTEGTQTITATTGGADSLCLVAASF
jgi:hypothetical protein